MESLPLNEGCPLWGCPVNVNVLSSGINIKPDRCQSTHAARLALVSVRFKAPTPGCPGLASLSDVAGSIAARAPPPAQPVWPLRLPRWFGHYHRSVSLVRRTVSRCSVQTSFRYWLLSSCWLVELFGVRCTTRSFLPATSDTGFRPSNKELATPHIVPATPTSGAGAAIRMCRMLLSPLGVQS